MSPRQGAGRRSGRKGQVLAAGAVLGLAVVGGGVWAALSFFGSGPQPAEALPDSTLGYASVDLDPSGGQKIEAVKMLRKFPAFKDKIGLETDDDIRQKIFEEIQKEADCAGLDYEDDIEPWLGDRAAVAAVDTGEDQPTPVFVLQVKDGDQADEGLTKIQECGGEDDPSGWVIEGDWALIAETEEIARQVADDAAESPLSDDADYQRWTDEVGDAGVVNLYAARGAGAYLAENLDAFGMADSASSSGSCEIDPDTGEVVCGETDGEVPAAVPDEMSDALEDFEGMAATIRFNDGALELEIAGDPGLSEDGLYATDRGDDVLSTLPEDTAAAMGIGFDEGWFSDLADQVASYSGGEMSADELLDELSAETGLDLPEDAETLAGESVALGIGSDFDLETFVNSSDGSGVPIAAKIKGDPDAVVSVLDKLRAQLGSDVPAVLDSDSDGDMIAVGPDADYRAKVLEDGNLGDSEVFRDVVPEAEDSSAIFFINFGAGDGWLVNAAGEDPEVEENLAPLEGLGFSVWQEDDAAHALFRITTN